MGEMILVDLIFRGREPVPSGRMIREIRMYRKHFLATFASSIVSTSSMAVIDLDHDPFHSWFPLTPRPMRRSS